MNEQFLDFLLSFIENTEVNFNSYSTFEENWITESDSSFRSDFNYILTTSPCILNKDSFSNEQIEICNREAKLSKNGILTFTNSLSRNLRNILLEWKSNLQKVLNQSDAMISQTQFREVDFVSSFHVDTFEKLYNKIGSVYQTGFEVQYENYLSVFFCLILLIGLNYLWNLYESSR